MKKSGKIINQVCDSSAKVGFANTAIDELPRAIGRYEKPVLQNYGDVRDITLGPTPGVGESGNELARRPGP